LFLQFVSPWLVESGPHPSRPMPYTPAEEDLT
jgi:hypothetical protein